VILNLLGKKILYEARAKQILDYNTGVVIG
jgi:hypothetical protein